MEKMDLVEMTPDKLAKATDDEVLQAWHRLSQWYAQAVEEGHAVEDIVNAAHWVLLEFDRRGFDADSRTPLYRAVMRMRDLLRERRQAVLGDANHDGIPDAVVERLGALPNEVMLVRDFVSIAGSAAVANKPHDTDLAIRATYDYEKGVYLLQANSMQVALRRFFDQEKQGNVQLISAPQGPLTDYVPMYDLVLRRRAPKLEVVEWEPPKYGHRDRAKGAGPSVCTADLIREMHAVIIAQTKALEPLKPFTPMKASSGYHVGEFFDFDSLWEFWAKDNIKRGIVVETKYDGIRLVIHRKGATVKIFTEDRKRDRAHIFPSVVDEVLRLPEREMILDTEFVWWKDGKPIPREQMLHFVSGKEPISPAEDVRVNVHDTLWSHGSLENEPYTERLRTLKRQLPRDMKHLRPVWWDIANTEEELRQLIERASRYPGSEGAMLKAADSTYSGERTADWAKYKTVKEVKVQVIGKRAMPRPWDKRPVADVTGDEALREYRRLCEEPSAFLYRAAVLGEAGVLVPLEADERLTDSMMLVNWSKEHNEWRGLDDPRVWSGPDKWNRKPGELALATTYASGINAKIGDILTVQTVRVRKFKDDDGTHYTWMFPIPREQDPTRQKPDTTGDLERLAIATEPKAAETLAAIEPHIALVRAPYAQVDISHEGDETHARAAMEYWNQHWHEMYPHSGSGRFAYQHHWRGLTDETVKLDEAELLKLPISLHGDVRLQKDDSSCWGFTVFLGTTEANRAAGGDRLIVLPINDNLEVAHKLPQPIEWLDVGVGKPAVSPPGSVGATEFKYSKFFSIDRGTWDMGVWREHMQEVFLHGKKLKGRFVLMYYPVGGRRVWIIDRPTDQTPMAQSRKLDDVVAELRQKHQRWLIWAQPGETPRKIDVDKYKPENP